MALLLSILLATPRADWLATELERAAIASAPEGVTRAETSRHHETVPPGCNVTSAELLGRLQGSGEVVFRLKGLNTSRRACVGWSWGTMRLFGPAWVTTKDVPFGATVAEATAQEERELPPGHTFLHAISPDAVAALTLKAGTALETKHLRMPGEIVGREVPVELRMGDLVVSTSGETVPCLPDVCARLTSGKRVRGVWADGRLEVTVP